MTHTDQQSEVAALGFSPDALAERKNELLALLRQTAPEIVCDNQIDLERLKALLGQERTAPAEHYELSWAGKTEARREIQKTTSHTLRPSEGNPEQAPHMLIEGENLEVLRVLQKSYYGKVKMIYIDPPYNTGNDSFVYPDDYSETLDEYQRRTGEKNEAGYLNKQSLWKKNSKESGQYHSAWLSMMYPRLYLARNLLREDGVIFISIDDNEAANLKLLCDEIFGEDNFLSNIVWQKKYSPQNDAKYFSDSHEHILCYARNIEDFTIGLLPRSEEANARYKNPDDDPRGPWKSSDLTRQEFRERDYYAIVNPDNGMEFYPPSGNSWGRPESKVKELIDDGRIWFGPKGTSIPSIKRFLSEVKQGITPQTIWERKDVGDTQEGKKIVKALFGNAAIFETPKPTRLIQRAMLVANVQQGDIVLDFFAGSGTTVHAVMELNISDGGNRQCICVQMPELLEENSEAYKAGYRTIADITRARIDKVIEKFKAEYPEKTEGLACAHFTLAPSNFKVWRNDLADADAIRQQLEIFQQTEKTDVDAPESQTAMLTELLLKQGLGALGVHAISKPRTLDCGVTLHRVLMPDDSQLWLCFEPYVEALRDEIIKAKPAQMIMLNSCFVGEKADEQLSNLQLELAGLDIGLLVI
ncbi:site-specific DNA-methyltransferase [Marinobacterium sediminicola]|uniref:site-specific DNA-methyltransferase (adenine-specific) n=1 Tax=Marinobacterium sediminicola TaxID=518898 RepID=A0ABY1S2C8_9GAMM|nr:site-specific DNA-methyltransferase [Marinobacterium sediminicola]ULG68535.1 site-specific DNA-methyltransferase [Marinobacterium sediminicola]SMR76617.1 adenine-specific DNA-methyltransferase [Marinobacterium sediminicola]